MEKEIKSGVAMEDDIKKTVVDAMSNNEEKMSPFVKLLWQEQLKYTSQGVSDIIR